MTSGAEGIEQNSAGSGTGVHVLMTRIGAYMTMCPLPDVGGSDAQERLNTLIHAYSRLAKRVFCGLGSASLPVATDGAVGAAYQAPETA